MASTEQKPTPSTPDPPKLPTRPETPEPVKPSVAHGADPKTVPATVHAAGKVG
jgi:hypothetical protein